MVLSITRKTYNSLIFQLNRPAWRFSNREYPCATDNLIGRVEKLDHGFFYG